MATMTRFDLERLRHGLEDRDAEALASLFAEDAELIEIDKDHPPTRPMTYRGRRAIAEHFEDVCARAMSHRLERPVVAEHRVAYTEACHYEDGPDVLCMATADLDDENRIVRQVAVTAWDA
jgi:ketosteroid isomerase-like protein